MLRIQLLEKDLFITFEQELETSRPLDLFGENWLMYCYHCLSILYSKFRSKFTSR